jgi:hypothetical protein
MRFKQFLELDTLHVKFDPSDITITWIKPEDAKNALEYRD